MDRNRKSDSEEELELKLVAIDLPEGLKAGAGVSDLVEQHLGTAAGGGWYFGVGWEKERDGDEDNADRDDSNIYT